VTSVQERIDGPTVRVGSPIGFDDRRFRSVAYSSRASEIDPMRRTSILGRQASARVIDWLLDQGVDRPTALDDVE
jgi:hypothetical protein